MNKSVNVFSVVKDGNTYDLHLGDCLDVMDSFLSESVDLCITSPPYWNQRAYAYWPTYENYISDVRSWVATCYRLLMPGRHCFWVIPEKFPFPPKDNGTDQRLYKAVFNDTEYAAMDAGFVCETSIVWAKVHGTQKMFGSYPYPPNIIQTPNTERICVWRKPGKADLSRKSDASLISRQDWVTYGRDLWKVPLDALDQEQAAALARYGDDLWEINGDSDRYHPAVFPREIPAAIMRLWSFVGDVVLDPFTGSGTTALAALDEHRSFIGIERDKHYFRYAANRIESAAAVQAAF